MNPVLTASGNVGTDPSNATTAYERSKPLALPERQPVMFVPGSGSVPHYTREVECLLRRRLRIASLIGLFGFGLFFIRMLLTLNTPPYKYTPTGIALHSLVVATLILASAMLWSKMGLSMRALRWLEGAVFGSMAVFFAYLHFAVFYVDNLLEQASTEELKQTMVGAITVGNCLRWLILIVLYGTFIPNTWRRCATVVGLMAVTPLLLSSYICVKCSLLGPYLGGSMFEMSVILGIGSAIAIFGSYKLAELEHKAYEARKLGQYILKRRLGAGGMGEVYLGEHMLLRRACAIKLIRPEQAGDPTTLSRFEREVQAMATLTHWNTVEIYDYGLAEDGTFFYVMEYLNGMSLQELVERHGPVPPTRAIHFLRQICAALKEAHNTGLIHRDIKPSNVLICERGGVQDMAKLLDFGLVQGFGMTSTNVDRLTMQGTILGSPPYMSPEQALGKANIDNRTDIYSLGGLAYYLLTGQPPFQGETAMELLMAHVHNPVTSPRELRPEIPTDLEEVLLRCLGKKPEDRFDDIPSLERALMDCQDADGWDEDQANLWWRGVAAGRTGELVG